jgi:2-hydroxychromene-2-carboxylate isomerase
MGCKIDHDEVGALPVQFCRACHPELNKTRDQVVAAMQSEQEARNRDAKRQALLRTQQALERCERAVAKGNNAGIEGRKLKSLKAKADTLARELEM